MLISVRQLRDVTRLLLQKTGSQADETRCVSDHLVNANLKGHDSHGVGMLPHYVALGKTRVAYLAGKTFDEEVMLDSQGVSTNDPKVMWEDEKQGALKPIARHKGGGLVLAAEMLAGLLSGGGTIQPENEKAR